MPDPPSTIRAEAAAGASKAPAPISSANDVSTATGVPTRMARVSQDLATNSEFCLTRTNSCRTGGQGPPGRLSAECSAGFTSVRDEIEYSPASARITLASVSSSPSRRSGAGRPAECGPAASGTRTVGPGARGMVGTAIEPLVLGNW